MWSCPLQKKKLFVSFGLGRFSIVSSTFDHLLSQPVKDLISLSPALENLYSMRSMARLLSIQQVTQRIKIDYRSYRHIGQPPV